MLVVKKLGMKLNTVEPATLLLHRLDLASLVGSGGPKTVGKLLHYVTVVVPNGDV